MLHGSNTIKVPRRQQKGKIRKILSHESNHCSVLVWVHEWKTFHKSDSLVYSDISSKSWIFFRWFPDLFHARPVHDCRLLIAYASPPVNVCVHWKSRHISLHHTDHTCSSKYRFVELQLKGLHSFGFNCPLIVRLVSRVWTTESILRLTFNWNESYRWYIYQRASFRWTWLSYQNCFTVQRPKISKCGKTPIRWSQPKEWNILDSLVIISFSIFTIDYISTYYVC